MPAKHNIFLCQKEKRMCDIRMSEVILRYTFALMNQREYSDQTLSSGHYSILMWKKNGFSWTYTSVHNVHNMVYNDSICVMNQSNCLMVCHPLIIQPENLSSTQILYKGTVLWYYLATRMCILMYIGMFTWEMKWVAELNVWLF